MAVWIRGWLTQYVEPVYNQGQLDSSQYLGTCIRIWSDKWDFTRTALSPCCTLPPLVSRRGWLFVPLCQRLNFYKKFLLFLIKKKNVIHNQRFPNTPRKKKSQFGPVRILFLLLERKGNLFSFTSPWHQCTKTWAWLFTFLLMGFPRDSNIPYSLSWGS